MGRCCSLSTRSTRRNPRPIAPTATHCCTLTLPPRFPNWGTRGGSGGTRGEHFRDNGKRTEFAECRLPFETELQLSDGTSFCASKSPKFPCILPCKAVFLSKKHNNDPNDGLALIKKQNH